MAAFLNEKVIAPDLTSETRWAAYGWCPMAMAHGLQACWSTPISSAAGKVLGAFAIYYNEPSAPNSCDQILIDRLANIARIAIEGTLSETALRRSEAFFAEAQQISRTGSFSWRPATGEITWSGELYRIFELDQAMPLTRELVNSRVYPEDIPSLDAMIDRARGGDCRRF